MQARRGFSLPELMLVIGLISLLVAGVAFGISRYRENAEDARLQAELTSIYKGMEAYRVVYGRYPRNYAELRPFTTVPNFDQRYEINPNP